MLLKTRSMKYAVSEKEIMEKLEHPFIIELFGAF